QLKSMRRIREFDDLITAKIHGFADAIDYYRQCSAMPLLNQIAIGWPSDRGMLTIWLAHVTFCTAYVAVVIASRLRELDRSIEE
ncbi:hypothetical protein MJN76_34950, partial [Salmonella enterica subsp. enterica serovar Anatum]|nr:hypothetical protein [Salmonella enterica subsp. enterica serovar Anatum]